jgi:hypothetical protein
VYTEGILLASITQHDRSDFLNRHASVEAGRNPYSDGYMSLSISEAGAPSNNEVNFNASVAWFPFAAGWRGAHVNANGSLPAQGPGGVMPSNVSRINTGRYRVDLGVDARTDGMLFAIGNNNENVVVQTGPLIDGSAWDVRVASTAVNHAATGADKDWSFLYLPYDTPGLIGGYYDGLANSHVASVGSFTMDRLATGQYELTIPGESPETGMLILTVAFNATSTVTAPDDNILTYQPSAAGSFLINSYDLPTTPLTLQNTKFVWAFISFDSPMTSGFVPGDFDDDGDIDGGDFLAWQSSFEAAGGNLPADGNRDGVVNGADLAVWQQRFGSLPASTGEAQQAPEPAGGLLLVAALAMAAGPRRARRYFSAGLTHSVRKTLKE